MLYLLSFIIINCDNAHLPEYDPDGLWLWTQWTGTIREMTFSNVIFSLLWSIVVDLYTYHHYTVYLIAAAAGKSALVLLYDMNPCVQYKVSTTWLFYLTLCANICYNLLSFVIINCETHIFQWSTAICQCSTTFCGGSVPRCEYNDRTLHSFNASNGCLYIQMAHRSDCNGLAECLPLQLY